METQASVPEKREIWWVLGYVALYVAYNSVAGGENEKAHWLTMVAIPVVAIFLLRRPTATVSDRAPTGEGRGGGPPSEMYWPLSG